MKIEKTGYNYRTRKELDIMAFIYDANGEMLDAIHPGIGNHRTALGWATWRANTIREDYPAANTMAIHCGNDEIAVITLDSDNGSKNGTIDFTMFGSELVLHPESNNDYPTAPYYVTNENKWLSNWRKEIDGRAAKEIYLCESWEEAQRVANYLRKETDGGKFVNKYTNISSTRPPVEYSPEYLFGTI